MTNQNHYTSMRNLIGTGVLTLFVFAALFSFQNTRADDLHLKNGKTMVGSVTKQGDQYIVDTQTARIKIPASEVKKLVEKETPWETYQKKVKKLKQKENPTADDYYKLYRWATDKNLNIQASKHLEKALKLNPNHKKVRKELGFVQYKETWMSKDQMMREKGFQQWNGEWLPKETVSKLKSNLKKEKYAQRVTSQIEAYLHKMASTPSKTRRKQIYEDLLAYGMENNVNKIRAIANRAKSYYDRSWEVVLMRKTYEITSTIRLSKAELKRPIEQSQIETVVGISTVLGPVTGIIERPQLEVNQYKGTVVIPDS